jgi:hypothetical protein
MQLGDVLAEIARTSRANDVPERDAHEEVEKMKRAEGKVELARSQELEVEHDVN